MIPLCDLKQQYQTLKPQIDAAMQDVAAAARYILGPNVAELEREVAAYCDGAGLSGCAHWMRKQSQEEIEHAMKFYAYVNDRGSRVVLEAIEKPPVEFESLLDVFEKTYAHEQKVTSLIWKLYEVAREANDYATESMLQWYIDEQVEEEKNASEIVAKLKLVGTKGQALFMIDRALAAR